MGDSLPPTGLPPFIERVKMSGLRIHHLTERNCLLLVPHPGEIRGLFRTRNRGRKPKEYHIRLDNEGNCIVSETIWNRLQEVGANFIILNEVIDPPVQTLGFLDGIVETPSVKKEVNRAIKEIAPPGAKTYVTRHNG